MARIKLGSLSFLGVKPQSPKPEDINEMDVDPYPEPVIAWGQ